jgi:hypothetical protein
MSIPLLLNQDSNISNRNLNISKKISSHNENQEEKINLIILMILKVMLPKKYIILKMKF